MVSCFWLAGEPQPTPAVCLLRDCRESQRNIHSVRLGKPISYFRLDWSGLEELPISLLLSASPLDLSFTLTILLSFSTTTLLLLPPHTVLHLSWLFTVSSTMLHSRPAVSLSLSLPSATIKHNEIEILL